MNAVVEAGIRKGDTDMIYDALQDCIKYRVLPNDGLL